MGEFTIECPKCGSLHVVTKHIFGIHKQNVTCTTCGEVINIKEQRLISKVCPTCGKVFIYDQKKPGKRACPSCGTTINAVAASTAKYKIEQINCPQCSCAIEIDSTKETAFCPICDAKIDVKAAIGKSKLVSDSGVSVIKYEGDNNTLVWKHPIEDFNLGSQLIVHESQEAVFFLNGEALDSFGPGRHTLETENIPVLKKLYKMPTGGQSPFHAEIYFVNKAVLLGMRWGTDSRVNFIDPITGIPLAIGASGEANLQVSDARKLLIKLIGTEGGLKATEGGQDAVKAVRNIFRAPLVTAVKSYLSNAITERHINILEVDRYLEEISTDLRLLITPKFEEFGLTIPQFYVTTIDLPDDKNFKDIRDLISSAYIGVKREEVAKQIAEAAQGRKAVEAQTDAQLAAIRAQGEAAAMREKGFAQAEVMRAQGYSQKDVIEADVQKAYAQGMGQMGSHGGSAGGGVASDMVSMMAGMKMAGSMLDKMDGVMGGKSGLSDSEAWTCPSCGENKNLGAFCMRCGKPKAAAEAADTWDCSCGTTGITSRFCPNCGNPKPEAWDCSCGTKGITSKFCPNCGKQKPETWDCSCGTRNITSKFCPNCGKQKDE